EVQSFLVLKLPTSYLDNPDKKSDSNPDPKSTRFSVAEGGFEAEGELDNINSFTNSASQAPINAINVLEPEHQFQARILTYRVGREKPMVRILVWKKSMVRANPSGQYCVDVYAFHPLNNEIVAGHCPVAQDQWSHGVCVVDLLLPLKWWAAVHGGKVD